MGRGNERSRKRMLLFLEGMGQQMRLMNNYKVDMIVGVCCSLAERRQQGQMIWSKVILDEDFSDSMTSAFNIDTMITNLRSYVHVGTLRIHMLSKCNYISSTKSSSNKI